MSASASPLVVEVQDDFCPLPPDYSGIPFEDLKRDVDFNEAAVREVVISPLLAALRYRFDQVKYDHRLQHPYLRVGSQNRPVELVPDYSLYVEERFAWILDAKAPSEDVFDVGHIAQVYSYASHPEVRAKYFALCNGLDFVLFDTAGDNTPVLQFSFKEIRHRWPEVWRKLNVSRFQSEGAGARSPLGTVRESPSEAFNYATRPLLREIPVRKQQAKRHFGVHGYFTKQSWNVVAEYIRNYSQAEDVVLDPFGGSGVTIVEAAMLHRRGIHVDINPLANLIADAILQPVRTSELSLALERLQNEFERRVPKTDAEITKVAKSVAKLLDIPLSKDADVGIVSQLFTDRQKAQLATLRKIILEEKNRAVQKCLWLVLSSMVTKFNLTYHPSTTRGEGGGDSAAFRYYRYRIAPNPTHLDFGTYLVGRCRKVMAAKQEVASRVDTGIYAKQNVIKGSATDLSFLSNESVDYIYTDPPYGKKIAYLDLSAMWLAWLGLVPSEDDFNIEAIEGGSREKSKASYNTLIRRSIFEMYRVLKFDRWMSFVFAHKDPEFWHLIIESAESAGFEYVGATPQKNGASSFKKRQHPFTVLSGQLIINFRKTQNPKAILKAHLGVDFAAIILETIESVIARYDGATIEQINDELIIKGLELGFLDLLKKQYSDLTPLLLANFEYDHETEKFFINPNTKFRTHVDVRLRIRYFLLSYLRRRSYAGESPPTFDEICLDIMPLLKNGVTPENQTILSVLETIAEPAGGDRWRLKSDEKQGSLFRE